jgi:hypothetical protein
MSLLPCHALEHHRYVWLFITKFTNLLDGKSKRMLHVAPARCFESKFKQQLGEKYLSTDLYAQNAMVQMDITHID